MLACLLQKFMTLLHIARMFFPHSDNIQKVPLRRVNNLMKEGLIEALKPLVGHKTLYITTAKGVRLLKQKDLWPGLRALKGIDLKTFEHDEMVMDVRILFKRLLGYDVWISERVLKKYHRKQKVPDGITSDGKQKFVIEVERTLKNKRYYEKVFTDTCIQYRSDYNVLYITENESNMKWLMKEAKGWKRIYFVTRDALMNMTDGVKLINADGEKIFLERIGRGGALFNDRYAPYGDFDEGFDRWLEEGEEERRRFEEEDRRR